MPLYRLEDDAEIFQHPLNSGGMHICIIDLFQPLKSISDGIVRHGAHSFWEMFLSGSLTVSTIERLRNSSLSKRGNNLFFMFLRSLVISCTPCSQSCSKSFWEI